MHILFTSKKNAYACQRNEKRDRNAKRNKINDNLKCNAKNSCGMMQHHKNIFMQIFLVDLNFFCKNKEKSVAQSQ